PRWLASAWALFGLSRQSWDQGLIWPCATAVAERGHGTEADLSRPGTGDAGHSVHRGDDRRELLDVAAVPSRGDLGDDDRDRDLALDAARPVGPVGSAWVSRGCDDGGVAARPDRAARARPHHDRGSLRRHRQRRAAARDLVRAGASRLGRAGAYRRPAAPPALGEKPRFPTPGISRAFWPPLASSHSTST